METFWISVADSLPPAISNTDSESEKVLVKDKDGYKHIAKYDHLLKCFLNEECVELFYITHYAVIPD